MKALIELWGIVFTKTSINANRKLTYNTLFFENSVHNQERKLK